VLLVEVTSSSTEEYDRGDGGVTIGWLVRRIQDWDEMTWSPRKDARRKRKPAGQRRGKTVH
jgi:hypothetical protein